MYHMYISYVYICIIISLNIINRTFKYNLLIYLVVFRNKVSKVNKLFLCKKVAV